jgi:hypothetical protein
VIINEWQLLAAVDPDIASSKSPIPKSQQQKTRRGNAYGGLVSCFSYLKNRHDQQRNFDNLSN